MEGCYTLKEHEEYLANENEIEGVEEESDLWWAIRRGRAEQAAEIISISIGKAEGLRGGDPRWLPLSKATSSRAISAGASSVTMVEAEAKAESAEAKGSMRLRGGGYPLLPRHERRSNGRRFRLDRKHGAGEGIMNKIRKGRSLDVVREEDDGVGGVAGTTGGRHDTSMVAEERGCGGGSEASVSKRPPALAGEGVVEEGFEAISVTGLADTNGSRTEEGKLNRQHISVDQPGSRPQQKTKDQDGKSSSKGSKKRGARSWLAGWLPWRSAPSTASKNIKKSTTDIKMDGTRKRSSSKRSPTPPARGSSSRAAGLKINTMVHDAEVTANKEDEPRTPSDGVSHSSSWSMVDGNSDRVGDSANTSDTSIEMAQEDKATATQTQYINSTTDDGVSRNEADTTTTEPEKIDYASMVGEAGDYFYDPYGTDSGRKDKGVAKDDELDRWYPDYREDRPVFRKRHGYHRHLGEFKTPSPYRLGLNRAVVDLRGEFRQITTQDLYHPDGSLSRVWGQSNEDSWNGLLRGDLDDRTGPPPVPELRRHGPSLAALSQGGMRGHGSGLAPPPGLGYPEKPIRGVPDIFGNDFESGGGRYDGETASLSYGEVMMQRKKNQAVNKLERARRKPRFSMPAMPDIPRGLGRLVGRVIGHGERGEDRIGEDDDEERGVVEHRENIAGGDGEDSSKGIESHFSVHRFGRQRR
ncbi:hypothetical protein QBC40DRAFT_226917 [Triangularia verruculosa]|uniref:Uncharacterized protein n=1 Tax=Triangularia verruculosa TaxID=2587418 RepID=A0AAN6XG07_9PEZI|nr:hypothetical protein QBC40DRAFT_226917 [Triangularia verruculosa]